MKKVGIRSKIILLTLLILGGGFFVAPEILEEVEQSELDAILDKISKSGYNALSKQEKKTLFELSKRKEP